MMLSVFHVEVKENGDWNSDGSKDRDNLDIFTTEAQEIVEGAARELADGDAVAIGVVKVDKVAKALFGAIKFYFEGMLLAEKWINFIRQWWEDKLATECVQDKLRFIDVKDIFLSHLLHVNADVSF